MELGASVCTIHQPPSCSVCPIMGHCKAFRRQRESLRSDTAAAVSVSDYPVKVRPAAFAQIPKFVLLCYSCQVSFQLEVTACAQCFIGHSHVEITKQGVRAYL